MLCILTPVTWISCLILTDQPLTYRLFIIVSRHEQLQPFVTAADIPKRYILQSKDDALPFMLPEPETH